jgi:energy-converting hydrogenase Eha subunit A
VNHLDDDAELYALGLTDRERDAEIEAHLAACDACRARVVAAESAAAALAATLPPMPAAAAPRRAWWTSVAAAAAVVFAATTAFEANAARTANAQIARTDGALGAIASSHFSHTTLTSEPGVVVKALYARDGAWCYVLATGAPADAHVVIYHGTTARDMGALGSGQPATLFLRDPGRPDRITVVAGARVVARGTPVF